MESFSLATENPWWTNIKAIYEDKYIISVDSCPVSWIPRIFHRFSLDNDVINTLRGPRQVGKTTLVKLLIKKLLEDGIEGRRIFYWRCDLIQGPKDLVDLINTYIDSTRDIFNDRLYIFLDEISAVKDWQIGLKYLYDGGKLYNVLVILTGSHTIDIKKASERLPGRRGDADIVYDKIFVPMKFSEYVELRDEDLKIVMRKCDLLNVNKRASLFFQLAKSDIPQEINELKLYLDKINRLYDEYLLTGGIIKAICIYLENGFIPDVIYNIYVNSTIGDIKRWNKENLIYHN
ncbi:MAG: AAA family ATPase [Candidatus Hodarchaeota archaeon]